MKYCSTRGSVTGLSFREALFAGYTEDGGLFVPEFVPQLPQETVTQWLKTTPSYQDVVFGVVRLFISQDEIDDDALRKCVENAYAKFNIPEVIGIKECVDKNGNAFKIAELFHGPTASFKDLALTLVGQMMEYFLTKKEEHVIVLVATSGDTGSAAIKAIEGLRGLDIIVFYPDGKISPVQELQMNSSTKGNVHVYAAEGTSDDTDIPIRQSFPGKGLCSINSINWARVLIQTAHFVFLYLKEREAVDIFIPTGAAGNSVGGLLASLMGIPIQLFLATNENDNVEAFLNKGELRMGGNVIPTHANAMDIRYPYNLERIIYLVSDSETTANYMKICEKSTDAVVTVDNKLMEKIRHVIPQSRKVSDKEIEDTIKWCWEKNKYMICPHTATGVAHLNANRRKGNKAYVISTASPQKFPEIVESSGIAPEEWEGHTLLKQLQLGPQTQPLRDMTKSLRPQWYDILQKKIAQIRSNH